MMRALAIMLAWTACGVAVATAQAPMRSAGTDNAHARATLHAVTGSTGRPALLLTLTIDDGWHVSYRNPGETGLPTRLQWSLPADVRVATETWPVPRITRTDVGVTHTLEGEVPWVIEFVASPSRDDRLVALTVRYGVCREVCIPAQLTVQGALPGAASPVPAAVPERLRARLIRDGGRLAARRVAPGAVCLVGPPFHDAVALPVVLADTSLALPVALSRGDGRRGVHGGSMQSPDPLVLRQGARFLFVHGTEGVTTRLDFTRPAPGCGRR